MDNTDVLYYLDEDGYKVEIGAIVGYQENFQNPDNVDKLYIVRRLPNYANTVIMSECLVDDECHFVSITDARLIEVEPWKIGAI